MSAVAGNEPTPVEQELPPPVRTNHLLERGDWTYRVWCSQHDRHPSECFDVHYPQATIEVTS